VIIAALEETPALSGITLPASKNDFFQSVESHILNLDIRKFPAFSGSGKDNLFS